MKKKKEEKFVPSVNFMSSLSPSTLNLIDIHNLFDTHAVHRARNHSDQRTVQPVRQKSAGIQLHGLVHLRPDVAA